MKITIPVNSIVNTEASADKSDMIEKAFELVKTNAL